MTCISILAQTWEVLSVVLAAQWREMLWPIIIRRNFLLGVPRAVLIEVPSAFIVRVK